MKLKNLFKKLHSDKGLTGTDVAASIVVIVMTIGVVTAIYINTTNRSKEQIRYSAATRIATQIVENIQSMTYEEMLSELEITDTSDSLSEIAAEDEEYICSVKVATGYGVTITTSIPSSATMDIIRDITIDVSYRISNTSKTITLSTIKQRELLEQTNEPDLYLIDDYEEHSTYYYPIKSDGSGGYVVTATSDPNWYNYDNVSSSTGIAMVGYYSGSSTKLEIGATINPSKIYYWIPRYSVSNSTLCYCYGASDYKIAFSSVSTGSSTLWGYMVKGSTNSVISTDFVTDSGFATDDGKSGIWVLSTSTEYLTYISTCATY